MYIYKTISRKFPIFKLRHVLFNFKPENFTTDRGKGTCTFKSHNICTAKSKGNIMKTLTLLCFLFLLAHAVFAATTQQSYYTTLGVKPTATQQQIKKAYRKMAMKVRLC